MSRIHDMVLYNEFITAYKYGILKKFDILMLY